MTDISTGGARPSPAPRRVRVTTTEEAVRHVEHLIFNGALSPGEALPSEADLALAAGVSRLTMREGIKSLQTRGLLTVTHGRRSLVSATNSLPLRDFFATYVRRDAGGVLELLDVRLAVEVRTAEMAAGHASPEDLVAMVGALEVMSGATEDGDVDGARVEDFNDADVDFHAAVARASGNRVLSLLVEGMEEPLRQTRSLCMRGYRAVPHEPSLLEQHRRIYERIAAHDESGAARAMREHLVHTGDYVRAAGISQVSS